MQVNPGGPSPALLSSAALRQLNSTPQLALPAPVSATVLSSRPVPGAAALFQGELQLALTTELLSYISATPLPAGQSIRLQANLDGSFQATPVSTPLPVTAQASSALAQALRDLLPLTRSGAFSQLLESLRAIQQNPEPALPDNALIQARALLDAIPKVASSTAADAVQAWVDPQLQSLEALLAQGQTPAQGHPQQRLASLLQSLPPEHPGAAATTTIPARGASAPLIYERLPATAATPHAATAQMVDTPTTAPAAATLADPGGVLPAALDLIAAPPPTTAATTTPIIVVLADNTAADSALAPSPATTAAPPPSSGSIHPEQAANSPVSALREQISAVLADQHLRQAITHLSAHGGDVALPSHLQSLPQDGQQTVLVTSLPVQYGQRFHQVDLQIGQRHGGRAPGEHAARMTWVISLGFDLAALGRIVVRSELAGRHLEASFWTERDTTRQLIDHELPQLNARLQDLGLTVTRLQTLAGVPPGSADAAATTSHLVDLSV